MTAIFTAPIDKLIAQPAAAAAGTPDWLPHARNACLRIPPLWPLQSFVAVNPFVGLAGRPFADVCDLMRRVTHESMLMSADYFRQQFATDRITPQDLEEAIQRSGLKISAAELLAWLNAPEPEAMAGMPSLADIAAAKVGGNWNSLVTEEISKWCAAYFDEGQSAWGMPWKHLPLYTAWRQAALIDATPELLGFQGFRQLVARLPESSAEAVALLLNSLGLNPELVEDYLHRLLMTLPGWSSYIQYRVRDQAMHGKHDESLLDLLAVRLVFEVQLLNQFSHQGIHSPWQESLVKSKGGAGDPLPKQLLWHAAFEIGFQRDLCTQITKIVGTFSSTPKPRPSVQAVLCIDVRSEVMRRSLEACSAGIETLGFAGFFGMPIEYVPFGHRHGSSQVPVLLLPKYRVREHLPEATPAQEKQARLRLQIGRRVAHSWNAFKTSAVSCFSFVEAAGIGFAWKLVKDTYQLGASSEPRTCLSAAAGHRHHCKGPMPDLHEDLPSGFGIPAEDQVQLALGALKNMGLTTNFARLVLLCGHGSHTTNNPYAAGLDCGACGGHAGDANARVAAAILNQPKVRAGLEREGIHIPADTHFLAALHNTTTDAITLFDPDQVPPSHEADLLQLKRWLEEAAQHCRRQRAARLGLASAAPAELGRLVQQRSQDWSQVRPEWGLAGNAAFIAAPRERTQHLNLKGRVFLHNYHHEADTTKSTLELIMTAPMVVANWINLQYFASTVNNRLWGSGNKVTHNVTGTFGIQQGNGGDLQAGLPLQSVHNGETWVHEPLRLSVLIEAPSEAIDAIIAKHEKVRELVENGWLHLFAIEQEGRLIKRRAAAGAWQSL